MIVIVTGGRGYTDREMVHAVLSHLGADEIWHGGARGADTLAAAWAEPWGHEVTEFSAKWAQHGRKAGPLRNQKMIDTAVRLREECGQAIAVVAFPGGAGTADCVRRAKAAGLPVLDVTDDGFGPYRVACRTAHGIRLRTTDGRVLEVAADGCDVRGIP
jgi:hypothetical protein